MKIEISKSIYEMDPEDIERMKSEGKRFYAKNGRLSMPWAKAKKEDGRDTTVSLGRWIMQLPPNETGRVYHVNTDKMDFRKSNLMINNRFEVGKNGITLMHLGKGNSCWIDTDSIPMISEWKWYAAELKKGLRYVVRMDTETGKLILLHRVLLGLPTQATRDQVGNHIDFNTMDNRLENLEILSDDENKYLTDKPPRGSIPFDGVSIHQNGSTYLATLTIGPTRYDISGLPTAELAAAARNYLQNRFRKHSRRRRNQVSEKFDGRTLRKFRFSIKEIR